MEIYHKHIAAAVLVVFIVSFSGISKAAGDLPDTFVAMPYRVISVKGDAAKFRALNWMNDGSTGGIKNMIIDRNAGKDEHVSFEGHAIPGDNDLGGLLTVSKDNVGYYKLDYGTFRRWYDNVGGYYPLYQTLQVTSLENSDLHLDMGHFLLEFGAGPADDPKASLTYEHNTKNGQKSRTTWTPVNDTVTSGGTKRIGPSWADMDETTDTLTLRGKAEALGFTLKGQGSYEFFDGNNSREDKALSVTTASNNIIRIYSQPQMKLLTSNIRAERWSGDDKIYFSTGYHFSHNNSSEIFNLRTFSGNTYLPLGGSGLYKNGYARSFEDIHTWTGQIMSNLTQDLNFTAKGKAEVVSRRSSGDYFSNTANPSVETSWNFNNAEIVENKILRTGESMSLRYNGLPKTSLYAQMDMEQEHNWITEEETNPQASSTTGISREQVARNSDIIETVGVRFVPTRAVNMTTQYKHSFLGGTFNTLYKFPVTGSSTLHYNSLYPRLNINVDELASKVSWKPLKWLDNSLRYKIASRVYHVNGQSEDWLKNQMSEKNYIYDITLIPTDALMFNLSYSLQNLKASTRESEIADTGTYAAGTVGIPVYTANVYTWIFSTSYAPLDNFSVFNSVEFSRAKNANNPDTTASSMRYGVDDQWWNMTFGAKWSPKKNKDISVEPHYSYYSFRANQSVETGNYSAHMMWVDLKFKW